MSGDHSPSSSADHFESQTWYTPPWLNGTKHNAMRGVVMSVRSADIGVTLGTDSPVSPIQKARTSLFGASDKPSEIEVCGEGMDPRGVCVIDHPGRHAQFKQWYQAGLLLDDSRRMTLRDEGCKPSPISVKQFPEVQREGSPEGILAFFVQNKADDAKADMNNFIETLRQPDEGSEERNISSPDLDKTPATPSWKSRTFLMGKQLMVAMGDAGMLEGDFLSWCAWFQDFLCANGLTDRGTPPLTAGLQAVNADIDFSRNALSDTSILELVRVLSLFKRIQVRTLRLTGNAVSDVGLLALVELPYIHQLILSENIITRHGLLDFVLTARKNKSDVFEASVAQDQPDESLLRPLYITIEGNFIDSAILVLHDFDSFGLKACCFDSSGCESTSECRIFGRNCGVHLGGLGCQRKTPDLSLT